MTGDQHPRHHHDDHVVLLRGGVRDGQLTRVSRELTRLLAMSDAPGLLDVYERAGDTARNPETGEEVGVFAFAGQEPTGDLAPELQHMPGDQPVPGGT